MKKVLILTLFLLNGCAHDGYIFLCNHNNATDTQAKNECHEKVEKQLEEENPIKREILFPLRFMLGVPKEYKNY